MQLKVPRGKGSLHGSIPIGNFRHENRETSETPAVKPASRSAGEGLGRTVRVHVCEHSGSAILAMNHSNQDGRLAPESEEGRLLIKENTFPFDTYPTPSGTARVPRVGECADERSVWPLIYEKNRMR